MDSGSPHSSPKALDAGQDRIWCGPPTPKGGTLLPVNRACQPSQLPQALGGTVLSVAINSPFRVCALTRGESTLPWAIVSPSCWDSGPAHVPTGFSGQGLGSELWLAMWDLGLGSLNLQATGLACGHTFSISLTMACALLPDSEQEVLSRLDTRCAQVWPLQPRRGLS